VIDYKLKNVSEFEFYLNGKPFRDFVERHVKEVMDKEYTAVEEFCRNNAHLVKPSVLCESVRFYMDVDGGQVTTRVYALVPTDVVERTKTDLGQLIILTDYPHITLQHKITPWFSVNR